MASFEAAGGFVPCLPVDVWLDNGSGCLEATDQYGYFALPEWKGQAKCSVSKAWNKSNRTVMINVH